MNSTLQEAKSDDENEEIEVRCKKCRCVLHSDNAKDVGYCLPCFAEMMSEDEEDD
jgi:hypothetical protein